jgi:membrane protease YdiL (CAAX protease family)
VTLVRRILLFPVTRLVIATLLVVLLAVPGFTPVALVGAQLDEHVLTLGLEICLAAAAVGTLVIVGGAIELRPPAAWGFPTISVRRDLAVGFVLGAFIFSAVIAVLTVPGWYRITRVGVSLPFLGQLVYFVVLFLAVGVFEEVLMRGLLFRILEEGIGTWGALAISSLVFGLSHTANPGASLWSGLAIAISAGPMLAAAYVAFRSLWAPIGLHWAWNLFEGPIYGADVSGFKTDALFHARIHGPSLWTGSAFGPEDGLASVSVALLAALALIVVAVGRSQIVTPDWMRRLAGQRRSS